MTDRTSRRGFLRTTGAVAGTAAAAAGAAAGAAGAATQESEKMAGTGPGGDETMAQSDSEGTTTETDHGEDTHDEGGQFVLTDSLTMLLGFIVIGVLSPIAFAVFLARNYRDEP